MDGDDGFASTTTMTSVTDDTSTDFCSDRVTLGMEDDSSQVTPSDTDSDDEAEDSSTVDSVSQALNFAQKAGVKAKYVEVNPFTFKVPLSRAKEKSVAVDQFCPSVPSTQMRGGHSGAKLLKENEQENEETKMEVTAEVEEVSAPADSSANFPEDKQAPHEPSETFQPTDQDSAEKPWYQHDCFRYYWQHYYFVSLWCQKHMEVYKAVQQQYAKTLSANARPVNKTVPFPSNAGEGDDHVFKKPVSRRTQRNRKARRRRKQTKRRMKMSLLSSSVTESASSQSEKDEGETSEISMEEEITDSADSAIEITTETHMEISEEMLEFFAHSHKHRLEREASKKNLKTKKEDKHINIEEVRSDQKERTVDAPKEQPGSRRTAEMRLLYGKGAAMIHGMETALQMNFDRNLDVKQPKLWPNMPFKVIFS